MRHTVTPPEIRAEEMLRIDRNAPDYVMPTAGDPWKLYNAYCRDYDARWLERHHCFERCRQEYAVRFIFECGRIFGVRMERTRRRSRQAAPR